MSRCNNGKVQLAYGADRFTERCAVSVSTGCSPGDEDQIHNNDNEECNGTTRKEVNRFQIPQGFNPADKIHGDRADSEYENELDAEAGTSPLAGSKFGNQAVFNGLHTEREKHIYGGRYNQQLFTEDSHKDDKGKTQGMKRQIHPSKIIFVGHLSTGKLSKDTDKINR